MNRGHPPDYSLLRIPWKTLRENSAAYRGSQSLTLALNFACDLERLPSYHLELLCAVVWRLHYALRKALFRSMDHARKQARRVDVFRCHRYMRILSRFMQSLTHILQASWSIATIIRYQNNHQLKFKWRSVIPSPLRGEHCSDRYIYQVFLSVSPYNRRHRLHRFVWLGFPSRCHHTTHVIDCILVAAFFSCHARTSPLKESEKKRHHAF